ncbi:MAG: M20 family metallopeptidase [Candidatus Freyarchaeota archaeon]
MSVVDEVLKEADSRRNEIVELVQELIRFKSVNPPGDTREIAGFVKDYLSERGLTTELYESEEGKVSVVGTLKGKGDKRFVWNGHIDVVPVTKPGDWTVDPWEGKIVESRIVGRGAADMKGSVGAAMVAASILAEKDLELGGDLALYLVPDEETGGLHGTGYLVDKGILRGDACIVGEYSPLNTLCVGEKGVLWLRIKASGIPAHASLPFLGDNAIEKLYRFLAELHRVEEADRELPEDVTRIMEALQPTLELLQSIGFSQDHLYKLTHRLTVNVGRVTGGEKINMVPAYAEAEVDIRLLPGMRHNSVMDEINQILRDSGISGITIEEMLRADPSYQRLDVPLVSLMKEEIERGTGKEPLLFVNPGFTDARFIRAKGIPTVIFGAGSETAHGTNEYVPIDSLVEVTKVYALAAMDFLGTG